MLHRRCTAAIVAATLAAGLAAPATAAPRATAAASPAARLHALFDAEWAWRQGELAEVTDGLESKPGDHLPSVTPAAQERRRAYWTKTLAALDSIPVAALSAEDRISIAVFRTSLTAMISNIAFKTYEAPLNSDTFFWGYLAPAQGFASAAEYRRYLGRMRDIPRYFDENVANMRAGLARGYSVPRVGLEGRDKTLEPYVAPGAGNPFLAAFDKMPGTIPAAEQAALRTEAATLVRTTVAPAYAKLLAFMQGTYLPQTRTSIDAFSLPDGKAFYADQIREYTTLDLTADQIHDIGLKEVARIDADMQATMKAAGFKGSFAEFLAFLRADPQFYARTPRELLGFSALVTKKMDGKLKEAFGTLPRYRFTIRPVPDAIAPIYTSGRGGLDACLMNTFDLPARPLYALTALTLHECEPGHSFQAALALEAPSRPAFRRETYFSGYGEGWGLYTEWLGSKLGLYETPYEEFGRETFEMWRAVRLVIDTGMHAKGWSRERALAYLRDNTALSEREVTTEIDRYSGWPGQALSYYLGQLAIRECRAKAEKALGTKFDIRAFHDTVLALGSVPLPVLTARIDRFIAEGGPSPWPKPPA